jgi:4-hydroxyphenylpyruvate dioxygenase-like putative hemolysin
MHLHEHNPEPSNPLGIDGIEFIEFATSQPQHWAACCSGWASPPSRDIVRAK